ncbi:MAG TPA: L-seryl-tRNA(Sec) selenium transferase, partial [Gemmatales bacterium]|nr:L-seryl-tRNA(Sec) selenium transferase [Gemmatales bacterium]
FSSERFGKLLEKYPREIVLNFTREYLQVIRQKMQQGQEVSEQLAIDHLSAEVESRLESLLQPKIFSVINATGILLHTNLGRAPMAEVASQAAKLAAESYLNLEMDLATGKRSHRTSVIRALLQTLINCESATVVNNNAAATVLVLKVLAQGCEVLVSRGELVEIGGGFRIPEIMACSGAILKEVGSTNITRISDYERGISSNTALIMRVHTSNYRIQGHTHTPELKELVELSHSKGIPFVDDIGSGSLIDMSHWGLNDEPLAKESLNAGADLVLFSGDKLMGGPQSGIIAGNSKLVNQIENDPLMRAFRVDKMSLAALEATLRLYVVPDNALNSIPHFRMLEASISGLQERAYLLARLFGNLPGFSVHVVPSEAYVGGGSLPACAIPSFSLAIYSEHSSEEELARRLRLHSPAILTRIEAGKIIVDLRTVLPEQDQFLVEALKTALVAKHGK